MKRALISVLLLLTVLLSLCACDSGKSKSKETPPASGSDLTWEEIEKLADERLAAKENG